MPTDVIVKVGATNSPVSMTYSTLQSAEDACPANLVTADQRYIMECYDQGTFTGAVGFSGTTTDATRYQILRCATGASFSAKAGVRSTALHYNASGGVTIAVTSAVPINISGGNNNVHLDGLQIKSNSYANAVYVGSSNCVITNCIITHGSAAGNVLHVDGSATVSNCLIEYNAGTHSAGGGAIHLIGSAFNCTIACTTTSTTANGIHLPYNVGVVKNCAVFGFTTFTDSTPAAGSDYNATDNASAVTGSHNQTSLTFSAQFESVTADFRATAQTAGTGLHNGTPDSTNAPLDISQFTRDATTPYMGAWEASAPAISFTISPSTIPANHSGNITLTITGSGTTFTSGSVITRTNSLTGTTAVTLGTWTRISNTSATQVVTTGSGAGTWKLSIDGTDSSGTQTTATATLAVSPTTGTVSTTPGLTFTGVNTLWNSENPTGLITAAGVSGVSLGTITVVNDTSATATLTIGSSTGTETFTDTSTGATCTFAVNAVSGSITVTSPVQWQTYQRNGSNQASIPIVGTYTGGPGTLTIEASFNGGSYSTIATGSAGSFSGTLSAQAAGQGTLTVRFVTATGISTTVSTVGIGDVFMIAGQSNAVGLLDALQSYSHATLKATCFNGSDALYASGAWQEGNDPFIVGWAFGSPWPLLATHHMADQGVPCAFVETPTGGRSLAAGVNNQWWFTHREPAAGTVGTGWTNLVNQSTRSGVNSIKAVLWYQGENDIDGSVTRWSYEAALVTFADQLAATLPGAPKLIPLQLGYDGGGSGTPNDIRLANADASQESGNILGMPTNYDFTNALHIATQQEGQNVADRFWAVLKSELFGGTSGNGHGPRVTSCQYNTARTAITVCFDKVLKTGLTFSTTAWTVSGVSVTAVAYHGTNTRAVVLTLSGAASLPITVSFGLGGSTAGLVVPLGPDFALPSPAGTINLPAEPFKDMVAAAAEVSGGSSAVFPVIGSAVIRGAS